MADREAKEDDVLNTIFNPLLPLGDETSLENQPEYTNGVIEEGNDVKEVKEWEVLGVKAAESQDFETALKHFDKAVEICPERASGYNNRAQLLRLKGDEDGALQDLEKAIQLSGGRGKVSAKPTLSWSPQETKGDEDGALQDFKTATSLGNSFRSQ